MQEHDTCAHVLYCSYEGQVETLKHTIDLMEDWLTEAETVPDLLGCIAEYPHGHCGCTMTENCASLGPQYMQMAHDKDAIGWRRFKEGMICMHMRGIQ